MTEVSVEGSKPARTLVLVGRTGNGKSATGNTIITTLNSMIGKQMSRRPFTSRYSSAGVTKTCKLETTQYEGRDITVIDTPGLFDLSMESEIIAEELVRCLTLAKDGIDAVLVVFSVTGRLTAEEKASLANIRSIFGSHILNHTIIVFTNGDALERDDMTLQDYLTDDCPEFLKELLTLCDNRMVLFDNTTKDTEKRENQVMELLKHVENVAESNYGIPYTDELHQIIQKLETEFQKEQEKLRNESRHTNKTREQLLAMLNKATDKNHRQIVQAVHAHVIKVRRNQEIEMAKEREEKRKAQKMAEEERERFMNERKKMMEDAANQREADIIAAEKKIQSAKQENDSLRRALIKAQNKPSGPCSVL